MLDFWVADALLLVLLLFLVVFAAPDVAFVPDAFPLFVFDFCVAEALLLVLGFCVAELLFDF